MYTATLGEPQVFKFQPNNLITGITDMELEIRDSGDGVIFTQSPLLEIHGSVYIGSWTPSSTGEYTGYITSSSNNIIDHAFSITVVEEPTFGLSPSDRALLVMIAQSVQEGIC